MLAELFPENKEKSPEYYMIRVNYLNHAIQLSSVT